ncbi:MAG: hypothetical protein SPJ17_02735 [Anaeroplasma sp.]|uniref:hypothetical protein n=1 Tax=Anaeroplasma sp. TaxID=1872523 RepID=UPI002A90AB3D|nr:hypothetical protein [Anaeroplasma sp.]MDY5982604.1 hypothetical protein [Anaeroplasma sp.]
MKEEKRLLKKDIIEINDNKLFGYKVVREETIKSGKMDVEYVIMERDKNLRDYITLKNLEDAYYKAKNNIKEYKPMKEGLALFLFLLLIIPGILYVSKKRKEKKFILENNQKMKQEMAKIIQEGEQYRR